MIISPWHAGTSGYTDRLGKVLLQYCVCFMKKMYDLIEQNLHFLLEGLFYDIVTDITQYDKSSHCKALVYTYLHLFRLDRFQSLTSKDFCTTKLSPSYRRFDRTLSCSIRIRVIAVGKSYGDLVG